MKAAKTAKPDAYYPAAIKSCQWQGKTYGLPASAGAGAMFINTKLFGDKKVSAKREDMPKTWDDWKAVSSQFIEKDDKGGYKQIGCAPFVGNSWLYPVWSASFGGKLYDPASNTYAIDSTENQIWLEYWVKWLDDQYGGNFEALRTSGNWEGTYPNSGFNLGHSAMSIEGSWATTDADIPFTFEVTRFPVGPGATKSFTGFWPNWFMVPKGAKHPDEAFKFMEYLTTTGWVTWYKAIMDTPAWKDFPKDVLTDKLIKSVGPEKGLDYHKFFADYLNDAADMWNSPIEQFARDTMGSAVDEILSKKKTVKEGLATAQKACAEKLAQTVKS
jgi:multiple sugar transport system substrate-binding protein